MMMGNPQRGISIKKKVKSPINFLNALDYNFGEDF